VPERLYFGLRPKNLVLTQKNGLITSSRRFIAVCAHRDLALRIAKRREQSPILIEILAREASGKGLRFLVAGPDLYLVESVPVEFILFPKLRQDVAERLAAGARKPGDKPSPTPAPGTFIVEPHHFEAQYRAKIPKGNVKKSDSAKGWKKERRTERHKRDM
jgi:hypothetical protein